MAGESSKRIHCMNSQKEHVGGRTSNLVQRMIIGAHMMQTGTRDMCFRTRGCAPGTITCTIGCLCALLHPIQRVGLVSLGRTQQPAAYLITSGNSSIKSVDMITLICKRKIQSAYKKQSHRLVICSSLQNGIFSANPQQIVFDGFELRLLIRIVRTIHKLAM